MPESLFKYILLRQSALPIRLVSSLGNNDATLLNPDFDALVKKDIAFLQSFASNPVLLNGLLYSSHSFLERLQAFKDKPIATFRKKEWQTARTLAQYLARIAVKTSPFAGFTAIGVARLRQSGQAGLSISKTSAFHYNHLIFTWFKELLTAYPPFYSILELKVNALILEKDENFIFLLNSRNIESVQYLEMQPILDFILDTLQEKPLVYTVLREKIAVATGESTIDTAALINQLLEIGFLDFGWDLPLTDPDFLQKLIHKVDQAALFENKHHITDTLIFLQQAIISFASAVSLELRLDLMRQITARLQSFKSLLHTNGEVRSEKKVWFGRFIPQGYPHSAEQCIYQDNYLPLINDIDPQYIAPLLKKLTVVLKIVEGVFTNPAPFIAEVFQQCHDFGTSVPLLRYYEKYYLWKNRQVKVAEATNDILLNQVEKMITGSCDEVNISSLKLDSSILENPLKKPGIWLGALIQPYREGECACAVVNATFYGNGRMWGRYLNDLPPYILESILSRNHQFGQEYFVAEIADASCMNANLHPPLLPYQIVIAAGGSGFPHDRQLHLRDLEVALDEDGQSIILRHIPSGKRIIPYDMGLEAPENRSPMYRMLLEFSPFFPSHRHFNQAVNHLCAKKDATGIRHLPRISIDRQLILQRRSWLIPVKNIPKKLANLSLIDYYHLLRKWQISLKLPALVFYAVIPAETDKATIQRDQLKPQYLDFTSPVLVDMFHRHIKKGAFVKIEEMLPMPEQISADYCTEYVVEWRS